ncbi:probable beta-hexosaminidase fdl [Pectinophora gossypiella]|uniref:probable beta-hexosaminidase fdl n=1 Tax=Pectinophora gossypiella TaxID=13191 RepID=UPI00214EF224|nr:probable beta-hexosaminidase fdl [Pectinophora gossypiella]
MWQQISQFISTLLLLILQVIQKTSGTYTTTALPLWTWECVNDRCVPTQASTPDRLQSLLMCNMLCASMQLWPQPTGAVSLSTTAVPVRADLFQLQIVSVPSKAVHEHLQEAFHLLRQDLHHLERNAVAFAEWRAVAVHVTVNGSGDPRMRLNTDESYQLVMYPKFAQGGPLIVKITAKSYCGARHALETLHQLVWLDPYIGTLFMLEAANVEDAPRFGYRGLLLDTARNYFPMSELFRTIDAMAATKLNTFHWHISDSQAFPLKLSSVPQLAVYGAFGTGAMYTTEDVRKLVHRARIRGIRVLIEVDTPAHVGCAWNWGPSLGFGELVKCAETDAWQDICREPPCGQLNPRNVHVFNILEAIYAEIIHLTGVDDLFHMGGDDVFPSCWAKHFPTFNPAQLLIDFTLGALERLEIANGKLPNLTLFWSPWLNENIKTDLKEYSGHLGLQTRNSELVASYSKFLSGIRTVISHSDPWNLNSGMGDWFEENMAPYNSWQKIYEHRPWARGSSKSDVVGGEVTVWSSTLSAGGLDARLWPRAAAFAERLWSDRPEGATRPVHVRLDVHRGRLVARGIRAAPIWSMWCSHHTYTCG